MNIEPIKRERIAFSVNGYRSMDYDVKPCVVIYIDDSRGYADIELTIDEARVAIALIEQAIQEATQKNGGNK